MMRLLDTLAQLTLRDEAAYVDDHPRARRLVMRAGGWLLLVMIALAVQAFWPMSWWAAAAGVPIAIFTVTGTLARVSRAQSYRSGWLKGRMQMVLALNEAMQRGLSFEDWLSGELARDEAALGYPLTDAQQQPRDNGGEHDKL